MRIRLPFESVEQARTCFDKVQQKTLAGIGKQMMASKDRDSQANEIASWLFNADKKTLVLCGQVGNGKTTMMDTIINLFNGARLTNKLGYSIGFQRVNSFDLDGADKQLINMCVNADLLAIDDLGFENLIVKNYGNEKSPVIEILMRRYEFNCITVITTNLTPEQIRGKYGEKIADRLAETAKFVAFKNPSYRRQ